MKALPEFAIETESLRKVYRPGSGKEEKIALTGMDLKIRCGSMFGLLGPNGAGKSTFINILAGLVTKTSGKAAIWGYDITCSPRLSRAHIGIVPQEINMDVFFSPYETLEIQAGYYGVPKKERKTLEILTAVGLYDKKDAYVRHLSGGMKRRLLIAKALVHSPPVIVLDEPTAGVDIELREHLWNYIRKLNNQGTTIVLTTHYLEEAEELCDDIAIIHEGRLVTSERKENLLEQMDYKTLIIFPKHPIQKLPDFLSDLDTSIEKDGSLKIHYRRHQLDLEKILGKLIKSGLEIQDIRTREARLKDIFLKVIQHA